MYEDKVHSLSGKNMDFFRSSAKQFVDDFEF